MSNQRQSTEVDVHVGRCLKHLREDQRISQQALADALGISFQQVQKYERGWNRISASRLFQLCGILGVQPNYFFEGLLMTDNTKDPWSDFARPHWHDAVRAIEAERERQVTVQNRNLAEDDAYTYGELARAGASYALATVPGFDIIAAIIWPWDIKTFKPADRRRNLVKAAALIVAEIERLDRADMARQNSVAERAAGPL
jgi:transcriptional regulator with XRE-family HTH domain